MYNFFYATQMDPKYFSVSELHLDWKPTANFPHLNKLPTDLNNEHFNTKTNLLTDTDTADNERGERITYPPPKKQILCSLTVIRWVRRIDRHDYEVFPKKGRLCHFLGSLTRRIKTEQQRRRRLESALVTARNHLRQRGIFHMVERRRAMGRNVTKICFGFFMQSRITICIIIKYIPFFKLPCSTIP